MCEAAATNLEAIVIPVVVYSKPTGANTSSNFSAKKSPNLVLNEAANPKIKGTLSTFLYIGFTINSFLVLMGMTGGTDSLLGFQEP